MPWDHLSSAAFDPMAPANTATARVGRAHQMIRSTIPTGVGRPMYCPTQSMPRHTKGRVMPPSSHDMAHSIQRGNNWDRRPSNSCARTRTARLVRATSAESTCTETWCNDRMACSVSLAHSKQLEQLCRWASSQSRSAGEIPSTRAAEISPCALLWISRVTPGLLQAGF